MGSKEKPPCNYGSRCYRKSLKHLADFSHPSTSENDLEERPQSRGKSPRKLRVEENKKTKWKQSTIQFGTNKTETRSTGGKTEENTSKNLKNSAGTVFDKKKRNKPDNEEFDTLPKKLKNPKLDLKHDYKTIEPQEVNDDTLNSSNDEESDDGENVKTSWIHIKKDVKKNESNKSELDLKNKPVEEIIKTLFLVKMPPCFYSFFEFCKFLNENEPEKTIQTCGLHLVGPFDVLLGKMNLSLSKELALCHWRFFYDPPEFQTVLASTSTEFHIGYWRDDPNELPVFLASNDSAKDCIIKMEGENIFATIYHYCESFIKTCDPFLKVKIPQFQKALSDWAERHNFKLEKKTKKMNERQKKVVAKSFHKLGLVVPVDKKTEVGYRPLIETEKNIKNICKLIMEADNENEKESLWENLQPLITAANIANDECDFGNGLELGIDLFCMGSSVFHETIEHLLTVAYSLLNRNQFGEIIKAHLKRRKKGIDLSIN